MVRMTRGILWLGWTKKEKRVSSWACWLKCGNDFFHPFLLLLLIYCCVAIQRCCIGNSKWSRYVTLADAYYTAIDCLDGNNQKAIVTHNEHWLHHMQFIETEWVQREKKKTRAHTLHVMSKWKLWSKWCSMFTVDEWKLPFLHRMAS